MNIAFAFKSSLAAVLLTAGLASSARSENFDGSPYAPVRVSLGGSVRAKMDAFLAERVFGPEAKGRIHEEAVNAFRTHYDDVRTPEQDAAEGWTAGKGLWQGEYWGKSMLAAAAVAEHADDADLKAWLKEKALAFVKEFQRPDGYLCSYRDPFFVGGVTADRPGSEVFCWNLWGRKYTMWALLEIARITETPELLTAARKVMDQWMAQLAEKDVRIENTGFFVGLPSMSVLKPLLLLHRATGDGKYLSYADSIVSAWDRKGNPAPNLIANAFGDKLVSEWYAKPSWWAKAYEMMSCLEGLIAYSQVRNCPRVMEAVERIVAKLEAGELNAVGSVGFFDHFTHAAACPNATTEPCDVTHWIRVNRELFLATGKAHYLDNVEFAFYNAFLAGVYRDGKWGAHSVRSHGSRHRTAPRQVGMKYHQCCIDNMPRTFVDFAQTVVSRGADGALSVNLYSDANGTCGDDAVEISGGYPFGDVVTVRVTAAGNGVVRFRRPSWFDAMTVDGTTVDGDWFVSSLKRGENRFRLAFARSARIVDALPCVGDDARAGGFEVVHENPEMKGLARNRPAARLLYGPLVLAKAKCLGDTREEILDFTSVNGRGYSCSLKSLKARGVDGAWTATFTRGGEAFSVKVCDFASSADSDDPSNCFSIWF